MTTAAQFQPRRWLRNGHLQTIVGNFLPHIDRLPAATTELVTVPLPTEMLAVRSAVALDRLLPSRVLCHCHWQLDRDHAVTVVLVHGLEGSSHSQYIIGNANKLFAAGCNVVRMNMRNCGSTDALSPTLYHSGMSGDVKAVLSWLVERGCTRVVLAGYSMGGNLVLKAAGELAECAPAALAGAVAVSPPMDLGESADALHHWANRIYERRFLRGLMKRYRRKAKLFPAVFHTGHAERVHSIRDFDELHHDAVLRLRRRQRLLRALRRKPCARYHRSAHTHPPRMRRSIHPPHSIRDPRKAPEQRQHHAA